MATIDELVVKIKADIKDLESKMKKADSSVKKSSDKMKKSLDKTGKASSAFSKRMSNAATATAALQGPLGPVAGRMRSFGALMGSAGFIAGAFILAMAGIIAAFKSFVAGAMRAEMAMMKFQALVKSTGMAAGMTANELENFSRRMAKDTLFSVQQVRDASGVMLTFKAVTGDAFGRSMHVAGDLAAILGTDLKSAVLQLGKALENPRIGLSMLRRSGVSFTESQKEVINALSDTGRSAEAMDMILSAIEGQAGGVARAMAGSSGEITMAGAFDELSRKFTLFQEEMLGGTTLLHLFKNAVLAFANLFPALDVDLLDEDAAIEQLNMILLERDKLKKEIKDAEKTPSVRGTAITDAISQRKNEKNLEILEFRIERLNKRIKDLRMGDIIPNQAANPNLLPKTSKDAEELSLVMTNMKKKVDRAVRSQEALQIQTGKTGAALETLKFKQQILNEIFKDGDKLFETMTKSQKEAVDQMVEEVRKHAMATEQLQKSYNAVQGAVNNAFSTMENSIVGLIDGTKNLKDVMKDMLRSFVADLATAILKMLIFDKIKNAIMGGVGTALGVPTDTPIAASASGGAIGSNQPMLVGERGPEIFMPRTAGSIINANDSKGMMSGGQGVTVVQNNNFAVGVTPTVRAEVLNMMPLIKRETLNAVADTKQRGGGFRSALSNS